MTGRDTSPIRTCIGCRGKAHRPDLVRLVLRQNAPTCVVVDVRASLPGRGAWLHADHACLTQADRRRAVVRALRMAGPPDMSAVVSWFTEAVPGGSGQTIDEESGLEADGYPMSTQR